MKLYIMVCNFEKYLKANQIAFNGIKKMAKEQGFDVEFAYISQLRYTSKQEVESVQKDYPYVNYYLYDNLHTENECIFDCMQKVKADRYFVCDARYLEYEDLVADMIYGASYYGVHFVRCKAEYTGVFEGVVKFFKNANNKLLEYLSSSKKSPYIRNFVVFDNVVYDYMMRSPINSGTIRETDYLVNTNDVIFDAPNNLKKANHFVHNWANFLMGGTCLFLAIWAFACMFLVSMSFRATSWFLFAFIAFGVVGFVAILNADASSRTQFFRPYTKRVEAKPIFEIVKEKKNLIKNKEENSVQKEDVLAIKSNQQADFSSSSTEQDVDTSVISTKEAQATAIDESQNAVSEQTLNTKPKAKKVATTKQKSSTTSSSKSTKKTTKTTKKTTSVSKKDSAEKKQSNTKKTTKKGN